MFDLRDWENASVEPLLPIEKKPIGWSLKSGPTLLGSLLALVYFYPITEAA